MLSTTPFLGLLTLASVVLNRATATVIDSQDLVVGSRLESEDGFTRMSRSDDGPSPLWTVQQQSLSCGMVWFHQGEDAMSQYALMDIVGSEGCALSGQVAWAGLFQAEDATVAQLIFEGVCSGDMDLSWLPRSTRAELSSNDALTNFYTPTLDSDAITFMIVRNTCPNPVNVLVAQAVAVSFVVRVSTLREASRAASVVLAVITALLAFMLVTVAARVVSNLRSRCDDDDDEGGPYCVCADAAPQPPARGSQGSLISRVMAKHFVISSQPRPPADDEIRSHYQPLLSAKDAV